MTTIAGIRLPALPLAVGAAAAFWLIGFQTSVGGPPTDPPRPKRRSIRRMRVRPSAHHHHGSGGGRRLHRGYETTF